VLELGSVSYGSDPGGVKLRRGPGIHARPSVLASRSSEPGPPGARLPSSVGYKPRCRPWFLLRPGVSGSPAQTPGLGTGPGLPVRSYYGGPSTVPDVLVVPGPANSDAREPAWSLPRPQGNRSCEPQLSSSSESPPAQQPPLASDYPPEIPIVSKDPAH
jgi:hypothetical protein